MKAMISQTARNLILAVVVFMAVCVAIDLLKKRPIDVLTGERLGGIVAISLALVVDAVRKSGRGNRGANNTSEDIVAKRAESSR